MHRILMFAVVVSSFFYGHAARAQLPPGVTASGGTYYFEGASVQDISDFTPFTAGQITDSIGVGDDGGYFSNKDLCAKISSEFGGIVGVGLGALNLLSTLSFGLCPGESDLLKEAFEDMNEQLEDMCEQQEGIYPVTGSATPVPGGGECTVPGVRVVECDYTTLDVPQTCAGMIELCEESEMFFELEPTPDGDFRVTHGKIHIPNCECTDTYYWGEPQCALPTPVTLSGSEPGISMSGISSGKH